MKLCHNKKLMTQFVLQENITQLFPLKNQFWAAVLSNTHDANIKTLSAHNENGSRFYASLAHLNTVVLPNGIFVSNAGPSLGLDSKHHYQNKVHDIYHSATYNIKEDLDPQLISMIDDRKFIAVSADHRALYYYDLHYKMRGVLSGFRSHLLNHSDEEIVAITSNKLAHETVVIFTLNTGEVIFGTLKDHQFERINFVKSMQTSKDAQLFLNKKGCFSIYLPQNKSLICLNLNKNNLVILKTFSGIDLTNIKLSLSGDFLTAINANAEQGTTLVNVIDLKNLTHHKLFLKEALSDLAMGHNNTLCMSRNNILEVRNSNELFKSIFSSKITRLKHCLFNKMNLNPASSHIKQIQASKPMQCR